MRCLQGLSSPRQLVLLAFVFGMIGPQAAAMAERFQPSAATAPFPVCPSSTPGHPECLSIHVPTVSASSGLGIGPSFEGSGNLGGFSPADLRSAYKLAESGGSGQTVAIVVAYDDPNANADLKAYREAYKLPECSEGNGCFSKVNQKGETKNYPEVGPKEVKWWVEASLDIDMVSAACQVCHVLLVEANTNSNANLFAAEEEALNLGATEVSNSWEEKEFSEETSYDKYLDKPGVPITAAAGDFGYKVSYPAAAQYVISVGGTRLKKAENSRGWSEEVWTGTGSGCSSYESKPIWQTDEGCTQHTRTDNDVAAVASPQSPVSIYYTYEHPTGWENIGGTSAATPFVAGVEAKSNGYSRSLGPEAFAVAGEGKLLFDVTSGSNGTCSPSAYLCSGEVGYDGPTGWGTPNGVLQLEEDSWSLQTTVNPGEADSLSAVSCSSPTACTATGYNAPTQPGHFFPLVERWNGSAWQTQSAPSPAEASDAILDGVACYSQTACVAVGYSDREKARTPILTLAEIWNGTTWQIQTTANQSGSETHNYLQSVSCPSATSCIAVGEYLVPGAGWKPLSETWNGKTWALASVPSPTNAVFSILNSVSCASATACEAVGFYETSGFEHGYGFAERWDGKTWKLQSPVYPPEATEGNLLGVSCGSSLDCVAIGWAVAHEGAEDVNWAARWDGTKWSALAAPPSPGAAYETVLRQISCTSFTHCVAIGEAGFGTQTLAERWDGKEWLIQTTVSRGGSESNRLRGVSCTSSVACITAGYSEVLSVPATLAERFH